jgi:hypothetical protein
LAEVSTKSLPFEETFDSTPVSISSKQISQKSFSEEVSREQLIHKLLILLDLFIDIKEIGS